MFFNIIILKMLDIDQYTYTNKPYTESSSFKIKPLDENGRDIYFHDKEAHTKTYLDKLNLRLLRKIHQEMEEKHENFRTIDYKHKDNRESLQVDENNYNINDNGNGNVNKLDYNNNEYQNNFPDNYNSNNNNSNYYSNNFNRNKSSGNFKNNYNYNKSLNKTFNRYKPLDEKISTFGSNSFGKKAASRIVNNSNYNNKDSKNLRYGTTSYNNFYANNNYLNHPDGENNSFNKKKIGFESYNVPRIIKNNNNEDSSNNKTNNQRDNSLINKVKYNDFNKRCINSISSGFFKNTKLGENNNYDSSKIKFSNDEEKELSHKIELENQRLHDIIMKQTNEGFLKENKLPKISYICEQPQIVVKNTGIGNSKFMGNNYNPHNYNLANTKNRVKRNITGSLFNN